MLSPLSNEDGFLKGVKPCVSKMQKLPGVVVVDQDSQSGPQQQLRLGVRMRHMKMLKWKRNKALQAIVHHTRWDDTTCRVVRRGRSKAPSRQDLNRWQLWHPTLILQSLLIMMPD